MTPNGFIELLRPHHDDAARYCRLLCASYPASAAEDVFQEALVTAFEKVDLLEDRSRFRPWLFRIIQRVFLVERRRRAVRRMLPLTHAQAEPSELYDAFEQLAWKQTLLAALTELGVRQRATLLLHDVAGFKLKEIGDMLGDRSLSATKMRLSRARKQMRELLASDGPAPTKEAPSDLVEQTLRIINESRGADDD